MPEALAAVKRELGPDAVILGTRQLTNPGVAGWARRMRVEITAAPGEAASPAPRAAKPRPAPAVTSTPVATPTPKPSAPALPEELYPYYLRLIEQEVGAELAERIVKLAADRLAEGQTPSAEHVVTAIREQIAAMIPDGTTAAVAPGARRRIALVGPAGAGKTTTIAKVAALLRLREQRSVALLSLDSHRLDAGVQITRYAEALGVPAHSAQSVSEVKDALAQAGLNDVVMIDTPGVGPRDQGRFARLASLLRAAKPDETHLVLPASLAPSAQTRIAESFKPLGVTRLVLTHLDEVVGIGAVINAVDRLQLALSYLGTGQTVPQDLQKACGRQVAELLSIAR